MVENTVLGLITAQHNNDFSVSDLSTWVVNWQAIRDVVYSIVSLAWAARGGGSVRVCGRAILSALACSPA